VCGGRQANRPGPDHDDGFDHDKLLCLDSYRNT